MFLCTKKLIWNLRFTLLFVMLALDSKGRLLGSAQHLIFLILKNDIPLKWHKKSNFNSHLQRIRAIGFFLQHFLRFCVCNIADSPKCLQHRLLQHLFSRQKVCNTVLCNMSKKREISCNIFLQQKCCKNSFLQHLCRFWQCFEKQSNLERGQKLLLKTWLQASPNFSTQIVRVALLLCK